MLVKSTGIKGGGKRLLEYISRPDAVFKQQGQVFYIKQNMTGNTIAEFLKQYENNEKLRLHPGANRNKFYHDFLSFSPDSSKFLTPEVLEDLARKYMELRAENGIGISVIHIDKSHRHIHTVMGGCEYASGKSIRQTRAEFAKVKLELQMYQAKYPELAASVVEHGKGTEQYITSDEVQMKNRTGKPSRKEELRDILMTVHNESISREDFYEKIKEQGLEIYERGGQVAGIDDGRHYRFTTLLSAEHMEELDIRNERLSELDLLREDDLQTDLSIDELREAFKTKEQEEPENSLEALRKQLYIPEEEAKEAKIENLTNELDNDNQPPVR